MVHGLEAGQNFYQELFGWEYRAGPQQLGPYVRAVAEGHEVAGLGTKASGRQLPVAWLPYMASDDADETAGLIREQGGTVAVGPLDADTAGRMAIASDTLGAVFGVWQDATYPGLGIAPEGVRGAPVWFELITRETASAAKFYESVFGYETEPMGPDATDYLTLYRDGVAVAGIHGVGQSLPRDRGPHWRTYFSVEDTDAAVRKVRELGGQVVREPQDSPYGRLATVADPEGARFSVIRTERSPR
ncbi:VOC family protein [Streptomyces albiaxialis]|uniref:VOC family protein n=2 Tax=Streptomyces albiaxialis TaxID=329523 RepID=A0ABN2WID9_9ACTN